MSLFRKFRNEQAGVQIITTDPTGKWFGRALKIIGAGVMAGGLTLAVAAAAPVAATAGALVSVATGLGFVGAGGIAIVKGQNMSQRSIRAVPKADI